jgi:hypothetical protein
MAKMFYSTEEAAQRLGKSESDLKDLVRTGKLREFRDAGKVNYKVQDVDALAAKLAPATLKPEPAARASSAASASGEIILEAVEDSGVELAPTSTDVLSLADADAEETGYAMPQAQKSKGSTVVPSVGVNVFDDDELDEVVDPLAQTAVTDVAGLGIEGVGSGSGILNLTRESDDTSLGAELLEEIYTGEGAAPAEMGEATRAGLDEAITEAEEEGEAVAAVPGKEKTARAGRTVTRVEYGPDAWTTSLTAAMVVAVIILWFGGLAAAAMVRGVLPGLIRAVYSNLAIFSGGAVLVAAIAAAVTYFLAKRSG